MQLPDLRRAQARKHSRQRRAQATATERRRPPLLLLRMLLHQAHAASHSARRAHRLQNMAHTLPESAAE